MTSKMTLEQRRDWVRVNMPRPAISKGYLQVYDSAVESAKKLLEQERLPMDDLFIDLSASTVVIKLMCDELPAMLAERGGNMQKELDQMVVEYLAELRKEAEQRN